MSSLFLYHYRGSIPIINESDFVKKRTYTNGGVDPRRINALFLLNSLLEQCGSLAEEGFNHKLIENILYRLVKKKVTKFKVVII